MFAAAWTAAGYFSSNHYPEYPEMSHQEALATLDASGMLRQCGVLNDVVQPPPTSRLLWAVELDDGNHAFLPSAIAVCIERLVCQHRRDRKVLSTKKPVQWQTKLQQVNGRDMELFFCRRRQQIATPQQIKKGVQSLEELHVTMTLNYPELVDGPGTYWISGDKYPKRKLLLLNTKDMVNGLGMIRDAYDGGEIRGWCQCHVMVAGIGFDDQKLQCI